MSSTKPSNSLVNKNKEFFGCLAILASAFFFYFATVPIRIAKFNGLTLQATDFVHARFLLGFILFTLYFLARKKKPVIAEQRYLFGRAFSNVAATWCFFVAVSETGSAEANILNMTYPAFIVLIVVALRMQQREASAIFLSALSWVGIAMVMFREDLVFPIESLWGLASGFLGAIAIIFLNLARQKNDTSVVLLYMFGCGTVTIELLYGANLKFPIGNDWYYLATTALCGFIAQICLTYGFRFVTAIEGSIVGTSRIVIAAILGPLIAFDPQLSLVGWCGAILILITNVSLAYKKASVAKSIET